MAVSLHGRCIRCSVHARRNGNKGTTAGVRHELHYDPPPCTYYTFHTGITIYLSVKLEIHVLLSSAVDVADVVRMVSESSNLSL